MLMARWFQWGYSPQPPLYTWLQAALFRVLGESVASLALLRNALQLIVFVGFHLIARREFGDRTRTLLASVSVLLILEFVWDNQRERTHSLLALAIAVWQFRVLLSVIDRPRLTGTPRGQRDTESLWWRHENLHRATRLRAWMPPPSFAADRARVQAAMLASPAEAWTMAEDFLERWENVGRSARATSDPRWLRRYWEKVDLAAGAPALRPWRDPD